MKKQTSVNVDENFLKEANKVFCALSISFSDAVNLFLEKVSMEKGMPFDLNIPSDELLERIAEQYKSELILLSNYSKFL